MPDVSDSRLNSGASASYICEQYAQYRKLYLDFFPQERCSWENGGH
jgi:hypothetical protein